MQRRLRVDVLDRDQMIVLVHELSRDLAVDDLAEKTIAHLRCPLSAQAGACALHTFDDRCTWNALQVSADSLEAQRRPCLDELLNVALLTVSELHHQPTAAMQFLDGRVEHACDVTKPIRAAKQCDVRLVLHVGGEARLVRVLDVRRVGGNQIERVVNVIEIRGRDEIDPIVDLVALCVAGGDGQRLA